jgi:hypothetical protein
MPTIELPQQVDGLTRTQSRIYQHLRVHGPARGSDLLQPILGRRFGSDNLIATHVYRMRRRLAGAGVAVVRSPSGYALVPQLTTPSED